MFCGFSDDGDGVPANETCHDHVRSTRTSTGIHQKQKWHDMVLCAEFYLGLDLARVSGFLLL